ncbi:MAG: 5-methyltetrahydropteroyltriglutamate--homocysteine methyltransferase [Gemmataceae bacterium]
MTWSDRHEHTPHFRFDGGDLDCGNGLLLLIRKHLDPLARGQFLEILSSDASVEEDLPAWSRLTGNPLLSRVRHPHTCSYLIRKGTASSEEPDAPPEPAHAPRPHAVPTPSQAAPAEPQKIPPLAVMGIGSWPRPRWLLGALHKYLQGQMPEEVFHECADDAVRLAVAAQERAGVDVITDGEQRRDSYSSFIGSLLDCCQLIPITDLLPYVDDPEEFAAELRALDVPAEQVRHPAVLKPLQRSRPLVEHELSFVKTLTSKPIKIALPGPYLLTRTLWLECVSDRVYTTQVDLARDVVRLLQEEIAALLASGASLVQLDEPVLTEVVFGRPKNKRSFMCGALSEKRGMSEELAFASDLLRETVKGFPLERLGLHICRGNWSRSEDVALSGDYGPLMPLLRNIPVGTLFLEMCTPRAGEWNKLRELPEHCRVGVGVVNQKHDRIETVAEIMAKAEEAIQLFGPRRVLLNPDCGFATFADNPVASAQIAEQKLAAIAETSRRLRERHGLA